MALTEKVFRESTIAELLADRAGSIPLTDLASLATDPNAATRAAEIAPATPEIFAPDAISGSAGVGCLTQAQ
jgi:hypothetical protein